MYVSRKLSWKKIIDMQKEWRYWMEIDLSMIKTLSMPFFVCRRDSSRPV